MLHASLPTRLYDGSRYKITPMKNKIIPSLKLFGCLLISISLSGCFLRPYRFTVEQGNVICADTVASLQIGMSQDEVHYLMGTPLLQDVFHDNRWDYVYSEKPGYQPRKQYHVAIFFENGSVSQIQRDCLPEIA